MPILTNLKNKIYGGAWSIYDPESINAINTLPKKNISPVDFCEKYKEWIANNKNFKGWENFIHLDFSNGTTETFDKFYQTHSNLRLRLLKGEYFYHQLQSNLIFKNRFCWINDEPLSTGDVVVMSCPFADTGDIPEGFDTILSECDRLSIPVLIDMAYVSISNIKEIDLSHSCISVITSSLSKVFPVEHHRIGIRMRRKFEDDTLTAYNLNSYVNQHSVNIGYHMINTFSNSWLIDKYKEKQKEISKELAVDVSPCVIFGIDRNSRFSAYNRGGNSNRLCFSRVWDGRINNKNDNIF
jgi:hypothetical protein